MLHNIKLGVDDILAAETQRRRQSRPKTREIDRETVLKINRHRRHRSADNIWPPRRPCDDFNFHQQLHAATTNKKVGFTDSHSVDRHQSRKISNSTDNISIDKQQQQQGSGIQLGIAVAEYETSFNSSATTERKISQLHIWPPLYDRNEHKGKKFYLPEEKIHAGEVDELIKTRFSTSDKVNDAENNDKNKQQKSYGIEEKIKCVYDGHEIEMVSGKQKIYNTCPK